MARHQLDTDLLDTLDPSRVMVRAGLTPDPWQAELLLSFAPRMLVLNARQSGKSLCAAALGLYEALYMPPALVLLLSPSLRQSQELFRAVMMLYTQGGAVVPTVAQSALQVTFQNKSRIVALPGESDSTIRGYSDVRLLVIDEAARVPDDLYRATRPMLAVSSSRGHGDGRSGRLVCLSTPFGRQGWFYEEWASGADWVRTRVDAEACPRISAEFLDEERRHLGDLAYKEEYGCEFVGTREQFLSDDQISRIFMPLPKKG
jgi:hypothetical protein